MRLTIRFGKKDADLVLIASQYRLKDMLRLAIRHHLGETTETIPLPPNVDIKPMECTTVYLGKEDADIINFMKQFAVGSRSTVSKRLIRHATSQCDLRFFTGEVNNLPVKRGKKDKAQNSGAVVTKPVEEPRVENSIHEDDDSSLFDLI